MDPILEIMRQLSWEIRDQMVGEKGPPLPRIQWVPVPKPIKREERVKDQDGWASNRNKECIFGFSYCMLDIYFPPILATKYHSVNISQLMKDSHKCLGVAMWHVLRNQSFALEYLNTVHCKYREIKTIDESKNASKQTDKQNWAASVNQVIQMAEASNKVPSGPSFVKDGTIKASEFLFEPSVLIQLPWNFDLLHQWLVAALIEVLVFEKHALELIYWPLEKNVEDCATELVVLVRKLKERIMVGFCILFKKIKDFPKVDKRFPAWILDEVVLSSLSTLQFLITGKAYKVVKSIKKLAWSECKPVDNLVYMPVTAIEMDGYLEYIFTKFLYSVSEWVVPQFDPFCVDHLDKEKLENVITRINRNNPPQHACKCSCIPGKYKRDSGLEATIRYLVCHDQNEKPSSVEEKIKVTTTCLNKLFQADKVSMGSCLNVSLSLKLSDKETIENLFPDGQSTDLQKMIKLSLMNEMTNALLHDREKDCTVISQVVNLGLEVVERAQLVRFLETVYFCEGRRSPFIPNADKLTAINLESMLKLVHDVTKKKKEMNRTWLWSQLPKEWRNPVSQNEKEILLGCAMPDIVKICEGRIGRIIYGTVQTCLASPNKEVFQDWQTIQYVVPCHIATWLETLELLGDEKLKCKENLMKIINGVLTYYEEKFKIWYEEKESKPENTASTNIHEIFHLTNFYFEQICYIQATHFETAEGFNFSAEIYETLHGINKYICSISYFPALTAPVTVKTCVTFTEKWGKVGFSVLKDLYNVCVNSLHPITPSEIQHCDKIGQYYSADMNLRFLLTLFKCCTAFLDDDTDIPHEMVGSIVEVTQLLPTSHWVIGLIFKVMDYEENEKNDLPEDVLYEKKDMKTIYSKLKHVKNIVKNLTSTPLPPPSFFIANLPFNVPEFKLIAKFYIENNFEMLDKTIPLLFNKKTKKPSSSQLANLKTELQLNTASELNQCENCKKRETKAGTFIVCIKCVSQGFPNVNYYCNSKCQRAWWNKEHLAQHLEFELGLA